MDHSVTITANDSYNYYFNDYQSYNASALPPLQEQHQEGLGGIYSYNYNETSFHFTEWLRRSLFLDFDDSGGGLNATEGNDFTKGTDTQVLRDTLQVYGSLYVVLTALFCILRYSSRYNRFFNIRSWVEELQCEIAKTSQYGFVSWMWQVFEIDEEDILEQCGMDGLCFIRILRLGRKLSLTGCFHACWLIPVYATAEESSETSYLTDRLVKITTSNLPSSSPRFLATGKQHEWMHGWMDY